MSRGLVRRLRSGDHIDISGPSRVILERSGKLRIVAAPHVKIRHKRKSVDNRRRSRIE